MFTGLIETVGTVDSVRGKGNYKVFAVSSALPTEDIALGESIACDGACLTVVEKGDGLFKVEASQETLARTIAGSYRQGTQVHLERALQVGSRLGGHLVAGHVDDRGTVDYSRMVGESLDLAVRFNKDFDPLVIDKGSIAVNGVSLTINSTRPGWLSVNLIPHTLGATRLDKLKAGDPLNLEFDMIGKYILKSRVGNTPNSSLTLDKLLESGW